MSEKVRLAVIGCGAMGRRYTNSIRKMPDAQLVLVSDPDPTRAISLARELKTTWVDFEALAEHTEIQGVVVATPADRRAADAKHALRSGMHTFAEPPLYVDQDLVQVAGAVVRENNIHLVVGFPIRFAPMVYAVRRLMPSPTIAHGQFHGSWISVEERSETPSLRQGLPTYALQGLDLLSHIMGAVPRRVFAESTPSQSAKPGGTHAIVSTLIFPENRLATIAVGHSGPPPHVEDPFVELSDGRRRISVWDNLSQAEVEGFTEKDVQTEAARMPAIKKDDCNDGIVRLRVTSNTERDDTHGHYRQLDAFVQLVSSGERDDNLGGVNDSQVTMAVLRALGGSIRSGQPRPVRAA